MPTFRCLERLGKKQKNMEHRQQRRYPLITTLLLVLVFFPALHVGLAQSGGFKFFKYYSRSDYQSGPQNWSILQDKRGIIYVGNQDGVLEFDGVNWRSIQLPNGTARSMAMDADGTIYIGGINEFGFLEPDSKGSLQYQSLTKHLEESQKNFGTVWSTHATKDGIYFRTSRFLFRWDSRELKEWRPDKRIYGSYTCDNELFVYQRPAGIMKMKNDSMELIPGGEAFATVRKIFLIAPYDAGKVLIGTRPDGFFIHDGAKMTPLPTEADEYLNDNKVYHGARLSNGEFAMATLRGGVVIIDSQGRLKQIFNESFNMQDGDVKFVFEDVQGNLWAALNKGITKIEYASPISIYDFRFGLQGIVVTVTRHQKKVVAGTTSGLFSLSPGGKFQPAHGMTENCWDLLSLDDSLLAATSYGVFKIDNKTNRKQRIFEAPSYVLLRSKPVPNRIWVGARNQLVSFNIDSKSNNGDWVMESDVKEIRSEIRTIVEDKTGNLWLGTRSKGVFKVEFSGKQNALISIVTPYGPAHGLPEKEEINVFKAAGHVMFAAPKKGIYRFDEKTKMFIPDASLGEDFAGGPKGKGVFRIKEDRNNKTIWLHSKQKNIQAILLSKGRYRLNIKPFLRLPNGQVNAFYPENNIVWFAGNDGLIHYDTQVEKNYNIDFTTIIRNVWINRKQVFYGYRAGLSMPKSFPVIDYKDRNLRFEFAAPFFEEAYRTQYQCFLEGYDDDWSAWTSESTRNYTNLDPGSYDFRVQAKNIYNHKSREAIFQFEILTPLYRTWWAYAFYLSGMFMLAYLVVKWRQSRQLALEKVKLERLVNKRAAEIIQKNQQLESQTAQLKDQAGKLQEMAKTKSRFFANISHEFRTPLTLIMGPLDQLLTRDREKIEKQQLNGMLHNSQRLLTLINQLLDLSRFDSGKMKLQAARQDIVPFLKGIPASFENLAAQSRVRIEFTAESEDIPLYFDPEKMEEVIYNLLANALKFTSTNGTITVSVNSSPGKQKGFPDGFMELSVRDTGVGIPKDQLPHIFDRFFRADGGGNQSVKGTGIGLALTKEIVNLHHGIIDVHSTEGEGTSFIIRLPLGHSHLEPDEIIELEQVPTDRKSPLEIAALAGTGEVEPSEETTADETDDTAAGAANKNVILVVEDNAEVRKYIRDPLLPLYTVKEAADGKEGMEKARAIIPDLIISDIMMPEVDGYELCDTLKKDVRTSHIPIILLTAKASEASVIEGLETGADDYITKPFNTKILMTRIRNLIELRRQLQEKMQRQLLLQPAEIAVSSVDQEFIEELQEVIEKHLSDSAFNVEAMSKKLYMNRATLYRKIMALTGESPTQFIRSYRLKRGAQLLSDKFGNVSQVSLEVGFSNMAYFAKCFKEKFHQLPSVYQASEAD